MRYVRKPFALRAHLAGLVCAAAWLGLWPSRGQALTLGEAIRAAEATQERVGIADERLDQARAARWSAYTVLFPRASVSGTYQRRAREVVRQVGDEEVVIQRFDALSGLARADLRIFDPTAYTRIAAAGHAVDAARFDAAAVRRELWFEVAESFVSVIASGELLEAAEQRVERAELYARTAERRVEAGLMAKQAATRAELELAAARLQHTQARNALRSARLSLGYLIDDTVPEALEPPEGPLLADVPETELVRRAQALRPDVRALQARVNEADALATEPWLRFVPVLDGRGIYTWTNEAGFQGRNTNWNLAVTATWVAFDGGSRFAQAAERGAERAARELELDALQRSIRLEVKLALTDLATAMQGLEQAKTQSQVAELNRDEVATRFARGLSDALALADATQQAYEATAEVARQALALRIAEIGVLRAVGDWTGARP